VDRSHRVLLVALVVLALGRLPSFSEPLSQDQALFTLGAKMLDEGALPYRDFFDHKPPVVFFAYLPLWWVWGADGAGVALVDLLLHMVQALLLWSCLRMLAGLRAAEGAVFCFVLLVLSPVWSHGIRLCQVEVAAATAALAMAALAAGGSATTGRTVGAGFLAGCMVSTKFAPVVFALPALMLLDGPALRSPRVWGLAGLGFAGAVVPWLAWLAAVGVWDDFVAAVVDFNRVYGGLHVNDVGPSLAHVGWALVPVAVLATAVVVSPAKRARRCGLVWLATAVVVLVVQGKWFYYHFLVLVVPLAWLGGLGWGALVDGFGGWPERFRTRVRLLGAVAAACHLLLLGIRGHAFHENWLRNRLWRGDFAAFAEGVAVTTNRTLLETVLVAGAVRQFAAPGRSVMVWGMNPLLYLLADRPPYTRFVLHNWLLANVPPFDAWGDGAERRRQFLQRMAEDPPACFVVAAGDRSVFAPADSLAQFERDEELAALVRRRYALRLRVRNSYLWVLRGDERGNR